jgi:hypothetical protein
MGAISLPERGQPLDVNYIYDMASQINNLSNAIAIRSTSSSKVNENSDTTSNLRFYAATTKLNITKVSANDLQPFSFTYPEFRFAPVAVVSVVNIDRTTAGDDVSCTLQEVLTTTAKGIVKFNTGGAVNLSVNIIVVGIV